MHAACLTICWTLLAQTAPTTEADLKPILLPYYARQAIAYEFFLDANQSKRLQLEQQPLLTWTNAADLYLGAVFVWTYGGRPEVIGCIGSSQTAEGECRVFTELHSLSAAAIQQVKFGEEGRAWRPPPGGIELRELQAEKEPADSERERLTQMRNLARTFRGWMKQNGNVTELRLLPQPIYRYAARPQAVLDGALFALVSSGTDPEILLMLEAREDHGTTAWKFAIARFNWCELWSGRDGQEIWRVPQTGMVNDKPFISGRVIRTTLAAIKKTAAE